MNVKVRILCFVLGGGPSFVLNKHISFGSTADMSFQTPVCRYGFQSVKFYRGDLWALEDLNVITCGDKRLHSSCI